MNKLRTLNANEIEVRPAHKVGDKIAHLLYIDSRAVTRYLDEWVGWNNWQTEFYNVGNQIVGKLGIWDNEKSMWIWKSDVGSESNIEKEKGLISDTYKRLLTRFGVTELYSAPDILIPDDGYGNKGYKISEITYNDNREINSLVIVNRFNKEVYRWNINTTTPSKPIIENNSIDWIDELPVKPQITTPVELSPSEQLTNWYNTVEHTPVIDKFYNFWIKRLNEKGWTGQFKLQDLITKYCK